MARLTGEQLKDSYQNLLTIDATIESDPTSGQLENGLGNPITALGIGTDAPSATLEINGGVGKVFTIDQGTSNRTQLKNDRGIELIGQGGYPAVIKGLGNAGFGHIVFETSNNGEVARIDSSGNVGIGVSPSSSFGFGRTLQVEGSLNAELSLSETTNSKVWSLGVTNGTNFQQTSAGQTYAWYIGGSEEVRIDSDGLKFNGDTATANALDDYEEGTWTPVLRGATTAGTYSFSLGGGKYTKIGNMVTVWCSMVDITESSAGSGNIRIGGLPFTIADDAVNERLATALRIRQASATRSNSIAGGVKNTTDVSLTYDNNASGAGTSYTIASDFSANMDLGFQFSYFV